MRYTPIIGLGAALTTAGCTQHSRVANTAWIVGGRVSAVTTSGDVERDGVVGAAGGSLMAADTDGDWVTGRGRIDLWIGGNTEDGAAGQVSLDGGIGLALFDGEHHAFLRGGLAGEIERSPYGGLFMLEAPTVTAGYQFHGIGTATWLDSLHFEIGPRASLALGGRAFAVDEQADFVAAPTFGGALLMMGETVWLDARYERVFESEPLDILHATVCVALLLAACVDARQTWARFGPADAPLDARAGFIGVSLGFGWGTGLDTYF